MEQQILQIFLISMGR